MRAVLVGLGKVGSTAAQQLLSSADLEELVILDRRGPDGRPVEPGIAGDDRVRLGELSSKSYTAALGHAEVVALAVGGPTGDLAAEAVAAGVQVACASDHTQNVRALLALDDRARAAGVRVVAGAGMTPGLSCLLAAWLASRLDEVAEVHVASFGTGGPACARHHHAALSEVAVEYYDGQRRRRPGSSGRELVWFPEPVGGADCYRLNRPDPDLLHPLFPSARRITTRVSASRRDRLTSWLPMMRRPHPEGMVGALRVELRGRQGAMSETLIVGALGRPATIAGAVLAQSALWLAAGRGLRLAMAGGPVPAAAGLAVMMDHPGAFLAELIGRGVQLSQFEGTPSSAEGFGGAMAPASGL
jgi:saccharopine dehydrogenase-like NADP-dependent oxidoreductase